MDFSAPYSLRGDLGIENTSGKAEKANFFAFNAKHDHAAVTVSAVFGGLYYLKRTAEAVIVSDKGDSQLICHGIMSGGQRLETCLLVLAVTVNVTLHSPW